VALILTFCATIVFFRTRANPPAISLGTFVFEFTSCLFDHWGFSVELPRLSSKFCKSTYHESEQGEAIPRID